VVAAAIQFTQGVTVGPAGQALFGSQGTPVVVANGNDAGVEKWTFTVVDSPPSSAIGPGVKQSGGSNTWSFTPDTTDSFLIALTVVDGLGNTAIDIRSFTVKRAVSGLWIPPFSATAPMLNFGGSTRGWAVAMEGWLDYLYGLSVGSGRPEPVSFAFTQAGGSSATSIPSGALILNAKGKMGASPLAGGSPTLALGVSGTPNLIFPTNTVDNALTIANQPFDVPLLVAWPGGDVLATVGGGATSGGGTLVVDYVPSTQP
jgi:hypothetical protein